MYSSIKSVWRKKLLHYPNLQNAKLKLTYQTENAIICINDKRLMKQQEKGWIGGTVMSVHADRYQNPRQNFSFTNLVMSTEYLKKQWKPLSSLHM